MYVYIVYCLDRRAPPVVSLVLSVLAKLLSPGNCDQWQWPSCASSIQQGLYVLYINVHHWNATHYPIWISSHLHPFKSSIGWGIHQKNDLSIFQPTDQVTYIVQKDHISLMSLSINTHALRFLAFFSVLLKLLCLKLHQRKEFKKMKIKTANCGNVGQWDNENVGRVDCHKEYSIQRQVDIIET